MPHHMACFSVQANSSLCGLVVSALIGHVVASVTRSSGPIRRLDFPGQSEKIPQSWIFILSVRVVVVSGFGAASR